MLIASTAGTWTACALSGSLNHPDADLVGVIAPEPSADETDARREGKAAHWVGEGVLRGDAASAAEFDGETAPNGWIVTPDMVRHVQGYVDHVRAFGSVTIIEHPVELKAVDDHGAARTIVHGRVDSHVGDGDQADPVLRLFDLKYGWRLVEADQNMPTLCYAAALWQGYEDVEIHIYQPRPHHPMGKTRIWRLTAAEMWERRRWLLERAHAAIQPEALGHPGAHCRDCNGRARCHALAATVYRMFDIVEHTALSRMDARELADALTFLRLADKLVAARLQAVEAETEGRMSRSEFIPGWVRDPREGNRVWKVKPVTIQQMTGIDPYKHVLMSPAELENEGADPQIVELMITRPMTGRKLIPVPTGYFDKLFPKKEEKSSS